MIKLSPLTQKFIKRDSSSWKELLFYSTSSLKKRVLIEGDEKNEYKEALLCIAVLKSFFNFSENDALDYIVKNKKETLDKERVKKLCSTRLMRKLSRFIETQKYPYLIIDEITRQKKDAKDVLSSPEKIEEKVNALYEEKITSALKKSHKNILFSLIFLISLSMLLFLFFGMGSNLVLALSLLPPFLCSLLVFYIKKPPAKNRKRTFLEVMQIISKEDIAISFPSNLLEKSSVYSFVATLYKIVSLALFLLLFWAMHSYLNLSPLFSLPFLFLLSFFAQTAKSTKSDIDSFYIVDQKETFLSLIIDLLSYPLVKINQIILQKKYLFRFPAIKTNFSLPQIKISFSPQSLKKTLKEKKEKLYEE